MLRSVLNSHRGTEMNYKLYAYCQDQLIQATFGNLNETLRTITFGQHERRALVCLYVPKKGVPEEEFSQGSPYGHELGKLVIHQASGHRKTVSEFPSLFLAQVEHDDGVIFYPGNPCRRF